MTEQEIKKLIEQKQAELAKLQTSIEQIQYQKHVDAFMKNFNVQGIQNQLINTIKEQSLNPSDCSLFSKKICDNLSSIYNLVSEDIISNQTKRQLKNDARNKRRASTRCDADKTSIIRNLVKTASPNADTSASSEDVPAINIAPESDTSVSSEGRQY